MRCWHSQDNNTRWPLSWRHLEARYHILIPVVVCLVFFFPAFLVLLTCYHLCTSFSVFALCHPELCVFVSSLQYAKNQSLFSTCYLTHLTWLYSCNSLSTCWREVFVCFFPPVFSNLLCSVSISVLEGTSSNFSVATHTHTPLVAHLAGPEASVDSHAKKGAQCGMLSSLQLIHIKCYDAVCNNNRPCSSFSQCNHTWASGPCYTAVYIVFPLLTAAYYLMDNTLLWSPWWSLCFCLPACFIKKCLKLETGLSPC